MHRYGLSQFIQIQKYLLKLFIATVAEMIFFKALKLSVWLLSVAMFET